MQDFGKIMASEIAHTPKVFENILANISDIQKVRDVLKSRDIKSVLILARGTSDNAAHYLKYLIETQIGLPVGLTSPSAVSIYNSKLMYENTLIVAISQSGQSTDLVRFAKAAKDSGAYLLAMTNNPSSPLASLSDHHLNLHAGPELAVAATKSYSAQLFTSYLLVLTWTDKNIDVLKVISETSRLALEPNLISPTLSKLNRNHELVFLGRGFAYANAREAALKIQETNRISVQAYSTADYLHGPISALTSDTQVFFVVPSHTPYESISDAVKKIRETTKKLFWIGNGGAIEPGEVHLGGSNCNDEITSTIADAVVLQRLALEFAVKEGFNPDAPEGLSKVTLTI